MPEVSQGMTAVSRIDLLFLPVPEVGFGQLFHPMRLTSEVQMRESSRDSAICFKVYIFHGAFSFANRLVLRVWSDGLSDNLILLLLLLLRLPLLLLLLLLIIIITIIIIIKEVDCQTPFLLFKRASNNTDKERETDRQTDRQTEWGKRG